MADGTLPIPEKTSPIDSAIERQMKLSQNPLYRFGSALRGQDPNAGIAPLLQLQMQQRQFDAQQGNAQKTQQLQFMNILADSLGRLSSAEPEFRQQAMKILGPGLLQTSKTLGLDLDPSILQFAGNVPNAAKDLVDLWANSSLVNDDEKKSLVTQLSGIKGDTERRKFLDDFMDRKLKTITPQVETELPTAVARVKKELGLPPDQPIDEATFTSNAPKFYPAAKDPLVGRALQGILKEKAAAYGIKSAATAQKEQEAAATTSKRKLEDIVGTGGLADAIIADPEFAKHRAALSSSAGRQLEPGEAYSALPVDVQQSLAQRARQLVKADKVEVAERTGAGTAVATVEAKRNLPLNPKDLANYVDISALEKGQMLQPPAGINERDLISSGRYAYVDDKQKERFTGLKRAEVLIGQIKDLSRRAINAPDPQTALRQRGEKWVEAYIKSDPAAAAYKDAKEAFLGNLSRELGGERGVLTNVDIARIARALPYFGDTNSTRDLKMAIVEEILATSRNGVVGEMTGRGTPVIRSKVGELIDKLEQVHSGKPSLTPKAR